MGCWVGTSEMRNNITLFSDTLHNSSYACYRTTIKQTGRLQTCEADHIQEGEISTVSSNENYTIMMVHTPGRLLNQNYINR